MDVGAYGNPAYEGFNAVSACRDAEDFVREKKGYQVRDETGRDGTAVAWRPLIDICLAHLSVIPSHHR